MATHHSHHHVANSWSLPMVSARPLFTKETDFDPQKRGSPYENIEKVLIKYASMLVYLVELNLPSVVQLFDSQSPKSKKSNYLPSLRFFGGAS